MLSNVLYVQSIVIFMWLYGQISTGEMTGFSYVEQQTQSISKDVNKFNGPCQTGHFVKAPCLFEGDKIQITFQI